MSATRFALVSHVLPPSPSGQSVILERLLAERPAGTYCLISRDPPVAGEGKLGAPCFPLASSSAALSRRWAFLRHAGRLAAQFADLCGRARQIAQIAERERTELIIACTGDLLDLPAAYIASRMARIPFVPYLFDDYVYQWTGPHRIVARLLAAYVMPRACGAIVPNELLAEDYMRRYGIACTVVHNPMPAVAPAAPDPGEPLPTDTVNLVYAGSVYHAQADAFVNLLAALDRMGRADVRLHVFSSQSPAEIAAQGIRSPYLVHHGHVSQARIASVLQQADALFLPLAFETTVPEVIRTSAPGKTGEYLATGKPIVVHAPPDSFLSRYFRQHRCGVVVDRKEPGPMAAALGEIFSDATLRAEIGTHARHRADIDFDLRVARRAFFNVVDHASRRHLL